MVIQEKEKFKEDLVLLHKGIDYKEGDLEIDIFTNHLFHISPKKLTEIAKKNGYDKWSWTGIANIENGTCEAKFRKNI